MTYRLSTSTYSINIKRLKRFLLSHLQTICLFQKAKAIN